MHKPAAIYTRVSSDRQKEDHTIASQTAALIEYAQTHGYAVPPEWTFQDEGYSGATLVRPGLEALRDLSAEGQIAAVLVYSPDRLSRKYAYQVLLTEELLRCGVEVIFLKSPAGATPEDQLVVQFQGMIAEYERAQIAERSRRGKRHKAQQGVVNVLSGAPYGYRYVKKSDHSAAYYEVIEHEAQVVRMVFETYTRRHLSINAIARLLNEQRIPTRTEKTRWERSTVWAMLRNPAYQGKACYGKTELQPRQRITRPLRQRNRLPNRNSANHERPRQEWIEVAVPAVVTEEVFALAQEQLEKNKHFSPRRTKKPTLLQGMLVCQQCGYAMYRSSGGRSHRKLDYYRCIGSDGYRRLNGPLCTNRPVRQDHLDEIVWEQVIRLLEDGTLIQSEIDRRREVAQNTDPRRQRGQGLRREQARLESHIERLVSAYQEGLVTLVQLRQRMPDLQKRAQAVESELHSLEMAVVDETRYLKLAESLAGFRTKLRVRAQTLDVRERQQLLRLLVKEILVGADALTIRHSIRIPPSGPGSDGPPSPDAGPSEPTMTLGYRLRTRSQDATLRARVEARSAGGNGLIAAYALEGVLRLVLAGAGNRHYLVALLVDIRDDEPHLFAAHAAKIAGTTFHLWRERDLLTVLQRLLQNSDAEDEAAMELRLALLSDGLTATARSEALSLLATANTYFDRAYAAGDRRLDAAAYRSTIEVILAFHEGVGPKQIAATVRELEGVLEQRAEWLSRGDLPNWLRPRRDREAQWLRLARLAEHVAKALDRPSWLNASVVMDQVLAVYDADRTVSAGGGMAVLWRPRIVSALVRERGLRAHLDELLSADHWTTVHRVAAEELRRSIVLRGDPGESMGERHEGARFPLLSGVLTGEQLVSLPIDAAEQLEAAMGNKVWFQKEVGNPVVQCLGERLSKELLENDQYIGNVRVVFDSLMFQVLTFCRSRLDASRRKLGSRGEYRFTPDAVEWDLQLDLNEYLSGNLVGEIGTELSDIATGRADICVSFGPQQFVIELKKEEHDCSKVGLHKYLGQTIAYQVTNMRLGFLGVLDLTRSAGPAPHLEESVWVETIVPVGSILPRHVIVFRIAGNLPRPSEISQL